MAYFNILLDTWNPLVSVIPFTQIEACSVMQFATLPFVAVMHEERGVIYVSLAIDPCPRMVITNNCSFPLQLGQAEPGKAASKGN